MLSAVIHQNKKLFRSITNIHCRRLCVCTVQVGLADCCKNQKLLDLLLMSAAWGGFFTTLKDHNLNSCLAIDQQQQQHLEKKD